MAKNRSYEIVYEVRIKGNCTNGFGSSLKHKCLMAMVEAMGLSYPGETTIKVISSKGDFNAMTGETSD